MRYMRNFQRPYTVGLYGKLLMRRLETSQRPQAMNLRRRFNHMNIFGSAAPSSRPPAGRQILVPLLWITLLLGAWSQKLQAYQDQDTQAPPQTEQAQSYPQQTPEQLQQLVAPIALYPDSLVAQILAASTFPDQVVEADRWVEAHPGLRGEALGQAVDSEVWDPSVKALTAFPSVLGNMDKNLSWTSSLATLTTTSNKMLWMQSR